MHQEFFAELKKDHHQLIELINEIQNTSSGAQKKREDLFTRLKMELIPHMKAEEKHFYSALKEKEEARENAMEGEEEHHVTELVLKELNKLPKDDDVWQAKLSVFKELIEHHVEEEEEKIFEDARNVLDEDQIAKILQSFKKEKEKIKKRVK